MPGKLYTDTVKKLENRGLIRLVPPFEPMLEVRDALLAVAPADLFDSRVTAPEHASATVAGLLLWADCLEESHRLSQNIPQATGSYWHALMHRREPDYDNARYWVDKAGVHPAHKAVYEAVLAAVDGLDTSEARELAQELRIWKRWNPEAFIGLCRSAGSGGAGVEALEAAQVAEIRALLEWTRTQATSADSTITPALG